MVCPFCAQIQAPQAEDKGCLGRLFCGRKDFGKGKVIEYGREKRTDGNKLDFEKQNIEKRNIRKNKKSKENEI